VKRRLWQLRNLLRNLWLLRRELAERFGLRRRKPPRVTELRCLHCRRPLTKPCRPRHRAHAVQIPEGFGTDRYPAGSIVYVRQTKPGKQATEIRSTPF
jgi:hypothetical protein